MRLRETFKLFRKFCQLQFHHCISLKNNTVFKKMFSLDRPRDHDLHTIADFFEVLCLVSLDRVAGTDYLRDFIQDNRGDSSFTLSDGELEDVLNQVQWRRQAFQDWYPFSLIQNDRVLQAEEDLSNNQIWYVFLLLCGNLPLLTRRELYKPLTDAFEQVSVQVLTLLWPDTGQATTFGKNTTTFTGTKWERLNSLGKKIGGQPTLTENDFRNGDNGDGGIDIAAWLPLDDHESRNSIAVLGQCACSRSDWPAKQFEISMMRLRNCLLPSAPWIEMLFTPILFRDSQGTWAVPTQVASVTLFDRLRILNAIRNGGGMAGFQMPGSVADALEYRLDVV
ncbi:hypothetical protein [Pseudophaeobacter sp. C1-32P7]|uniref:hypothetical protein n=1 Tax=Pseudophaeobacter sp. C1-32P7 TaxID=3098142 RepID=UPI0034D5F447